MVDGLHGSVDGGLGLVDGVLFVSRPSRRAVDDVLDELVATLRVRREYLCVRRYAQAKADALLGMGGGILELPCAFSGKVDGARMIRGVARRWRSWVRWAKWRTT